MKNYTDFETNKALLESKYSTFLDYLKSRSISANKKYKKEVLSAAHQTVDLLNSAGADFAFLIKTKGNPVAYGVKIVDPSLPTVLGYGHYDVQPAEDAHFIPQIRTSALHPEGEVFARGSSDDKGQVYMQIKAFEELQNSLPCNFIFCIEGEEEVGSKSFREFLDNNKDLLACDVVVITDTAIVGKDTPSIAVGARGLVTFEAELEGVENDLHSGTFGGATPNIIQILSELISSFFDERQNITIPNFYDDVKQFTLDERANMRNPAFENENFKKLNGIPQWYGNDAFSPFERTTIRPTLEINGIKGGYTDEGAKTIVPSRVNVKFSMRLAPGQKCEKAYNLFKSHFEKEATKYPIKILNFQKSGGGIEPVICSTESVEYLAAHNAMKDTFGKEPIPLPMGGSIGILSMFDEVLKVPNIMLGFGLDTDAIHSPKEHFGLFNFFIGIDTLKKYYQHYGSMKKIEDNSVRRNQYKSILEKAKAMSLKQKK